jgi:hypothetical protein
MNKTTKEGRADEEQFTLDEAGQFRKNLSCGKKQRLDERFPSVLDL